MKHSQKILSTFILAATLGLLGGMLPYQGASAQDQGTETKLVIENEDATVRVVNNNFDAVIVTAVSGVREFRMGLASANTVTEFTLPHWLFGDRNEVRLVSRRLASRNVFVSQTLAVYPGEELELRVQNTLNLSYAFNRR